eukprot:Transcript_24623.p1 GENE.Transcript_24623~~Transcript_24623.p1  ORF type:complete len:375 (+),score=55.17 Transcript_24623:93-1217(+)
MVALTPRPSSSSSPSSSASWRRSTLLDLLQEFERDHPGLRHNLTAWQLSQGLWRLSRVEWPEEDAREAASGAAERERLRLAARASVLASASYSTFGALLVGWSRGVGPLLATSWRLLRGAARPQEAAFETHTRALGLRAADLLHAQWRPQFFDRRGAESLPVSGRRQGCAADGRPYAYTPAHFVVVDHQERSVVLVVRGSLDLEDVLADLQVAPTRRDQRRLGRGCHGGMADAAWRLAELHEARLRAALRAHRGYTLVLTGLAAGRKGPCTLPDDAAPSAPPGHRPGPRPLLRSPSPPPQQLASLRRPPQPVSGRTKAGWCSTGNRQATLWARASRLSLRCSSGDGWAGGSASRRAPSRRRARCRCARAAGWAT